MATPALFLFAVLSFNPPAEHGPVALRQAPAASHELLPPHDAAGDHFQREVAEEDVDEEDVDGEALPCSPCRPIEEVGPASCLRDSHRSPLPQSTGGRNRPQRAPPAP